MSVLKPCPFCGGAAQTHNPCGDIDGLWYCICTECAACSGFEETKAEAIAAWNTRAPVEYDDWFYLPKPEENVVQYGTPRIEKSEIGYRVEQPVEVIDDTLRSWSNQLGEHIMKRLCEVWNTRHERTCEIVTIWKDSDYVDDVNYKCSECGGSIPVNERNPDDYFETISAANYCPNCGAKVVRNGNHG